MVGIGRGREKEGMKAEERWRNGIKERGRNG